MKDFCVAVSESGSILLCHKETGRTLQELPVIQADDSHRSFILSTWVRSYASQSRKLSIGGLRVSPEVYRVGESLVAENKWAKSSVVVSPSDPYTIHAWVCGTKGRLWHVYVPPSLRGGGMARKLVERFVGTSYEVSKPWPNTPRGHQVSYNPYMNGTL